MKTTGKIYSNFTIIYKLTGLAARHIKENNKFIILELHIQVSNEQQYNQQIHVSLTLTARELMKKSRMGLQVVFDIEPKQGHLYNFKHADFEM
uniref:Uncharacterized protein n=1 Tax=Arundo donax TaxID=35708 RepID=A0A0A9PR63_ARUDO